MKKEQYWMCVLWGSVLLLAGLFAALFAAFTHRIITDNELTGPLPESALDFSFEMLWLFGAPVGADKLRQQREAESRDG